MGRITTKPDQASGRGRRSGRSGCRENPAAVTDPQRQAGRLQAVADPRRELEVFRPDQKGQATARIPQLSQIQRRKDGQRQRAQIRPLRPPQAASERRESPSAIMATVRKLKAAEGVSGRRRNHVAAGRSSAGSWKKIQTAARSDQEGQAGSGSCGRSSAGRMASGRGRLR